jgi:3-oxoadipate enol-lactonase
MLSAIPEKHLRTSGGSEPMPSFVEVPGGRLRVVDEGAGPPIVLLHAGIACLESWDGVAPLLVGAGYRVVRYDARGWGQSTTADVAFSEPDDLVAILDAAGIGRAALVGNSRGGATAFDTAILYPDREVAVVGVASGLGGFDGDATAEEIELFTEMDRLESLEPPDPAAVAEIDVRIWVDGPGQPPTRVPAWIREAVRSWDEPLYAERHISGSRIRLDPPAAERLDELRVPVLAVAGALDATAYAQIARHLETNAPQARAIVWPDVAHMIGMEVPERLAGAIVEFLAPLPRWR